MSNTRYHSLLILLLFSFLVSCERSEYAEIKKLNIGNLQLAYYTRGQGEPLVMIMGFRGTMALWDPALLEILEKKYQLIIFDNRGAGLSSDSTDDNTTIAQMANDTAQLVQSLGHKKVHVLGWSMGSRIALEMAINHSELVDRLILCSPNPGGSHQAERSSDAYRRLTELHITPEEGLSLIYPNTAQGKKAIEEFVGRLKHAILHRTVPDDLNVSNQTIDRQIHALKLWDENNRIYDELAQIKAPALVAGGLSDVIDSPDNVRLVASRIPFAWTAYFAGAGHAFMSQDYKNFAELVILFIESSGKDH